MAKLAYTVTEAAEMIGLGRTTIYKLIAEGQLQTVRVGARRLVTEAELRSMLDRLAVEQCGERTA